MRKHPLVLFMMFTVSAAAQQYQPGCSPFPLAHMNDIMTRQPFDETCGVSGNASGARGAQDTVKNNLCAAGSPALVTLTTFRSLQQYATQQHITTEPTDRSILHNVRKTSEGDMIGEGTLVHAAVYILKAKPSDLGSGESVNCNQPNPEQNDIHIALVDDPTITDECQSMTAEMIPHYRPTSWTPQNMHYLSLYTPVRGHHSYNDYDTSKRPVVRITGQLFYDSSHKVCKNGGPTPGNPARFSNWEIHPVYAIDVCTSDKPNNITDCDPGDETVWTPLDQWRPTQ